MIPLQATLMVCDTYLKEDDTDETKWKTFFLQVDEAADQMMMGDCWCFRLLWFFGGSEKSILNGVCKKRKKMKGRN